MSELDKMQALFHGAVIGQESDFLAHIEPGGKISRERRLGIYQHAYRARLRDVLQEDFPVLHSMLGDDAFHELCQRYIDVYPSEHPSLRFFGQHMATLVSQESPYKENPVIGELARFEGQFHDVFDAPDAKNVSLEEVGALPPMVWTTLRFLFHPSVHMTGYHWNVAGVWSSVKEEAESPTMPEQMPEEVTVIQWRYDLRSYYRSLDKDEATALRLAYDHKAFPEICEALVVFHGDQAPGKAAAFLRNWVVEGLISGLDHADLNL